MKHQIQKFIALAAVMLLPWGAVWAETVSIASRADLEAFANRVNNGETDLDAVLTADIDMDDEGIFIYDTYYGTFDGQGHRIYNYWRYSALFPTVAAQGVVKNLTLQGESNSKGGGIVENNQGLISHCVSDIEFDLYSQIYNNTNIYPTGGVCSYNFGIIENCSFVGEINISIPSSSSYGIFYIGGIAARSYSGSIIRDCVCYGSINYNHNNSDRYNWYKSVGLIVGDDGGYHDGLTNNYYNLTSAYFNYGGWSNQGAIGTTDGYNGSHPAIDIAGKAEGKNVGYLVDFDYIDDDYVTVFTDKKYAAEGETVTLTANLVSPTFVLDLRVERLANLSDAESRRQKAPSIGNYIDVTRQADGTYTFTMPDGPVLVSATLSPGYFISKQWSTLYASDDLVKPAELNVYTIVEADLEAGTVTLSEPLQRIPKQMPLLLEYTGSETLPIAVSMVEDSKPADVDVEPIWNFRGVSELEAFSASDEDYSYYVLSDGDFRLFQGVLESTRCYLMFDKSEALSRTLHIVKGDATGVSDTARLKNNEESIKKMFNLQGQRVDNADRPGLYIVGGKKLIKK